jgi:hypothetical protein
MYTCMYVSAVVYASLQHLAVPLSVYVNTVTAVSMQSGDSHFWSDLMKVKDQFLHRVFPYTKLDFRKIYIWLRNETVRH